MPTFEGKCPNCGKTHYSTRKAEIITCDCWQHCPLCGAEMQEYTPDLSANIYGLDGKRDLNVLMVCSEHIPSFFSTQKPVEVVCS